jgi:hypothetical protein
MKLFINQNNMKKMLLLLLSASTILFSCKKEVVSENETETEFKVQTKTVMTLPGQGNIENYLIHNADGTYSGYVQGFTIKLNAIIYATGNFNDGEAVVSFDLGPDDPQEGASTTASGPFFYKTFATINYGSNFRTSANQFFAAYGNYINQNIDPTTGQRIQSYYPSLSEYYSGGWSQPGLISGMIVRSHASPSSFSIVPATFVPPIYNTPAPEE